MTALPLFTTRHKILFGITLFFVTMPLALHLVPEAYAASAGKNAPRLFAVVVGVAKYQDKSILPLEVSAKDAGDFASFLRESAGLFQGKAHITLLVNQKATRANIAKALRRDLKSAKEDDVVILYFSGHGAAHPSATNEFYFLTHDTTLDNLFGTALLMNDVNLFKQIGSKRVLMIADSCYAAGFVPGLEASRPKAARRFFSIFEGLDGRVALSSSRADEESWENPRFGNSVFTHFLLKGLRGQADLVSKDGNITAQELYQYVYRNTEKVTDGKQHPQLYSPKGSDDATPVFPVRKFAKKLNVKVQFEYLDDNDTVNLLTDGAVLRSGQRFGVSFRPDADCYVYIFWWDSSGQIGRLFPNPELTDGGPEIKGGKTYWLPTSKDEEAQYRWYVLDDRAGEETFYFVASRKKNEKLEKLYAKLSGLSDDDKKGRKGQQIAAEMEREIQLMGVAHRTWTKAPTRISGTDKGSLFETVQNEIEVSGADVMYRVKFRHLPQAHSRR